jgi:hypothetical protein
MLHCEVSVTVVVQPLDDPLSEAGGGGSLLGAASAGDVGVAMPVPIVPELALPPPLALPQHETIVCGSQVKPGPQSDAVAHGRSYLGRHAFTVTGLHCVCDLPQLVSPGLQLGALHCSELWV